MKLTNASSKTVTLLNGVQIKPKESISIKVEKGTDLQEQINSLIANEILDKA